MTMPKRQLVDVAETRGGRQNDDTRSVIRHLTR